MNDFAITFEEHARISEAKDDNTITHVAFNFSSIERIQHIQKYKSVDVIAVIIESNDKEQVNTRSSTVPRVRAMFTLLDDSHHQISLALWGDEFCEKFKHLHKGSIVAIKGAKVSDFGGHSLNAASDHAQLFTDLVDNPNYDRVNKWYSKIAAKSEEEA